MLYDGRGGIDYLDITTGHEAPCNAPDGIYQEGVMSAAEHNRICALVKKRLEAVLHNPLSIRRIQVPCLDKLHKSLAHMFHDFRITLVQIFHLMVFLSAKGTGRGKNADDTGLRGAHRRLHRRLHAYEPYMVHTSFRQRKHSFSHLGIGPVRILCPKISNCGGCCRIAGNDDNVNAPHPFRAVFRVCRNSAQHHLRD